MKARRHTHTHTAPSCCGKHTHTHTHNKKLTNYGEEKKQQEEKQSGERGKAKASVLLLLFFFARLKGNAMRKRGDGERERRKREGREKIAKHFGKRDNALKIAKRLRKPICGRCSTQFQLSVSVFAPFRKVEREWGRRRRNWAGTGPATVRHSSELAKTCNP